jgi:hypothetical protein
MGSKNSTRMVIQIIGQRIRREGKPGQISFGMFKPLLTVRRLRGCQFMPFSTLPRVNPVHTREKLTKRYQGRRAKEIEWLFGMYRVQRGQNGKGLDQITQPS